MTKRIIAIALAALALFGCLTAEKCIKLCGDRGVLVLDGELCVCREAISCPH